MNKYRKERLERLRQKYLQSEPRQEKIPNIKQLPVLQKPVANTRNEQKFETIQKEGSTLDPENTDVPLETNLTEEANEVKAEEKVEVKQTNDIVAEPINDALSKSSKVSGSVLLSLKKELEEEKKKRQELEQMVQELLSRTGYSQKNASNKKGI